MHPNFPNINGQFYPRARTVPSTCTITNEISFQSIQHFSFIPRSATRWWGLQRRPRFDFLFDPRSLFKPSARLWRLLLRPEPHKKPKKIFTKSCQNDRLRSCLGSVWRPRSRDSYDNKSLSGIFSSRSRLSLFITDLPCFRCCHHMPVCEYFSNSAEDFRRTSWRMSFFSIFEQKPMSPAANRTKSF